jgi:hypothetical protein
MADKGGGKTDARGVKRGREDGAAAASSPPLGSSPIPVPPFLLGSPLLGGGAGLGGGVGGGFWVWVPGPMLGGGGGGGPYPYPLPPSSSPPIPLAPPPPAASAPPPSRPAAPSPALAIVGAASTTVRPSSSSLPPQRETPAPSSRGAGAAERAPKSARFPALWTKGAPRWAATKEEARSLLDGAEDGMLAVYEGGAGRGPIHFLRWSSGTYYLHSASRPALEPGKKGKAQWSRATVLERARSLGFVVEEKVEGEWIEVDLEEGADDDGEDEEDEDEDDDDVDVEGELAESPFDAAVEDSLAVFEGGDDDPVHILRPYGGSIHRPVHFIPAQASRALKPGASGWTKWSRATVLELAHALGFAVEQKKNGKWVGLELEGAEEAEGAEETG